MFRIYYYLSGDLLAVNIRAEHRSQAIRAFERRYGAVTIFTIERV